MDINSCLNNNKTKKEKSKASIINQLERLNKLEKQNKLDKLLEG